jgi:NTE family protein
LNRRTHVVAAFAVLAITGLGSPALQAQEARPKTCLVLGGGGARGAAHIGVLKVLERERIPIDCVVGTSMGSIVGGLYASGYKADEIAQAMQAIDWGDIFQDDPPRGDHSMRRKEDSLHFLGTIELGVRDKKIRVPQGVVQGQKLLLTLRRLLLSTWDVKTFDELPIPFRATATNIVNGDEVIFSEGDIALAIRASMSVPGVFAPIKVDGKLLVDGGIADNVPVTEGRKLGGVRLIVVDVGTPIADEEALTSPLAIANQVISVLVQKRIDAEIGSIQPQDVFIQPQLGELTSADFDKSKEAIAIGLAAAEQALPKLKAFSVDAAEYARFEARHRQLPFDAPLVAFLDVTPEHTRTSAYVEDRMGGLTGKPLDIDAVEKRLAVSYGEGRYEYIRWGLRRDAESTGLLIDPADKQWGPNYLRVGLRLSDDLNGRSFFRLMTELTGTGLNEHGGEASLRVELGGLTNLKAEFYQPIGRRGQFAVAPYAEYEAFEQRVPIEEDVSLYEFRRSEYSGGLQVMYLPNNRWRLSTSVVRGYAEGDLRVGDPALIPNVDLDLGYVGLRVEYDTLDRVGLPSSGARFDLAQEEYLESLGSDNESHVTRFSFDQALSFGMHRVLFGVKGVYADGAEGVLGPRGVLGGLTNLSGYPEFAAVEPYTLLGRVVYYRQIGKRYYAGGSIERGGAWANKDAIDNDNMVFAGSLFAGLRTPLGPLFLGYGRAEDGIDAFYLRLGTLIQMGNEY